MQKVVNALRVPFGGLTAKSFDENSYDSPLNKLAKDLNIPLRNLHIGQAEKENNKELLVNNAKDGHLDVGV